MALDVHQGRRQGQLKLYLLAPKCRRSRKIPDLVQRFCQLCNTFLEPSAREGFLPCFPPEARRLLNYYSPASV